MKTVLQRIGKKTENFKQPKPRPHLLHLRAEILGATINILIEVI